MTSDGKFTAEMLEDARSPAVAGMSRDAAVTHLRIKWGLERDAAERLLEAAVGTGRTHSFGMSGSRLSAMRRIYTGVAVMLTSVVAIIVLSNLNDLDGFVRRSIWVLLLFGAILFANGVWKRYQLGELLGLAAPMLLVAIAIVGIVGLVMAFLLVSTGRSDRVDDSLAIWNHEGLVPVGDGEYRLSGHILNAHSRLSIKTPRSVITLYNSDSDIVAVREVILGGGGSIRPGGSRSHDVRLSIPEAYDTYVMKLEFEWVE
jgi:hypothetical protein